MIVKILGIFDILVALSFWIFGIFGFIPSGFILILGLILLSKGIGFAITSNFVSFFDILAGIIIIAGTAFVMPKFIVIIVAFYLLQKGILSILA